MAVWHGGNLARFGCNLTRSVYLKLARNNRDLCKTGRIFSRFLSVFRSWGQFTREFSIGTTRKTRGIYFPFGNCFLRLCLHFGLTRTAKAILKSIDPTSMAT
jgi:hypothetical protein